MKHSFSVRPSLPSFPIAINASVLSQMHTSSPPLSSSLSPTSFFVSWRSEPRFFAAGSRWSVGRPDIFLKEKKEKERKREGRESTTPAFLFFFFFLLEDGK